MNRYVKKKAANSDVKSRRKKNNLKGEDVPSSSSSCNKNSKKTDESKVVDTACSTKSKKQAAGRTQKKKSVTPVVKRTTRKRNCKRNDESEISTSVKSSSAKTPKQLNASVTNTLPSSSSKTPKQSSASFPNTLPSSSSKTPKQSSASFPNTLPGSSSKTPRFSTPRTKHASVDDANTPCSFYKVTEDENGKPVFSKSLLKYFLTVDSPDMDDLKNKRWNTSFLHETPKPNREIRIFTEEEDNDPKYFENMPDFESNLPDVPGSLYADVFKSIPIDDSDEELKRVFQEMTPIKGPNGKKKRKSRRITCYNGKPFPDELLSFDYDGLLDSEKSCEDSCNNSDENVEEV